MTMAGRLRVDPQASRQGEQILAAAGSSLAVKVLVGAMCALVGYMVWMSRVWPLIHDAPLMHYIAWLISQGGVPYRDVFDMNLPGVYLIHLALVRMAGFGDWPWRLLDLSWLGVTCLLLFAYCRSMSDAWAAAAGALLFAVYHLAGGAVEAGQRDFLVCACLILGAHGVACGVDKRYSLRPLLLAGLALGIGIMIKPFAGLFWVLCAALAGWRWRSAGRSAWRASGAVLVGGVVVPAIIFGWLAMSGGLGPFLVALATYHVPLYSHVGRVSVWEPLVSHDRRLRVLLFTVGLLGALGPLSSFSLRRTVAVGGALCGAVSFWVQGKGWSYHLYPVAIFLCAMAPSAVMRSTASAGPRRPLPFRHRHIWAQGALAILVVVLTVKAVGGLVPPWTSAKVGLVRALTRDLDGLVVSGQSVQVMDTTSGGIHALLRLQVRQPTRFIYDFHFFHDVGHPRIEALRAEFISGLQAGSPAAIVILRNSWPDLGYERLAGFAELQTLLVERYQLAVERGEYRIYERRRDD